MNSKFNSNNTITSALIDHKFAPPSDSRTLLLREHLLKRMQDSTAKLITVQAPAGFGKTTLLQQFFSLQQHQQHQVIWLTLDQRDNDFERFLQHLSDACSQEGMVSGKMHILEYLVQFTQPFTLFLDESEHLYDAAIIKFLQQLLEQLPSHGQMVIGSRQQLPLRLASLRIRGQILDIHQHDLKLNAQECEQIIQCNYKHTLTPNEIHLLLEKTEGWVMAVHVLGLSLGGKQSPLELINKFSGQQHQLYHFLYEEILSQCSLDHQDFLLSCSVFSQLNASACNWLLKREDSTHMLMQLSAQHIFLIKLDDHAEQYRFHALFLSFLRHQLQLSEPQRYLDLHRLAAKWYLQQHEYMHAIEHFLCAKDHYEALHLLCVHGHHILQKGRVRFLLRCLEQIPSILLDEQPTLQAIHALALILNRYYHKAQDIIQKLLLHPTACKKQSDILHCLWLAMTDRIEESLTACNKIYHQHKFQGSLLDHFFMEIYAHYLIAHYEIETATQLMRTVVNHPEYRCDSFVHAIHEYNESCIDLQQGHLHRAYVRLHSNYHCSWREQQYSISGGQTLIALPLAEILYEKNRLDEALNLLKSCLPYARQNGHIDAMIVAYTLLAKLEYHLHHDQTAAQCYLKELEYIGADFHFERVKATAQLEQARIHWLNHDHELAQHMLNNLMSLDIWQTLEQFQMPAQDIETPQMLYWRIAISQHQAQQYLSDLQVAIKKAETLNHKRRIIKLKLILCSLYFSEQQLNKANDLFKSVLDDVGQEQYLRIFLDEGKLLHQMIYAFYHHAPDFNALSNIQKTLVEKLLSQINLPSFSLPTMAAPENHIEILTKRELQILGHAAEGLRNKEIADKIFLAETTVKAHLRRIHSKLDAHSRTEAVAIARRQGWL